MTVENQVPHQSYTANGVDVSYTLSFYVEGKDNLEVTVGSVVQSKNNYNYDAATNSVVFNKPLAKGSAVEIKRVTPIEREIQYNTYNNSLRPETFNFDFDRIIRILQELGFSHVVLAARLAKEIVDRTKGDQYLQDQILKEIEARIKGDKYLQEQITSNDFDIEYLIRGLSQEIKDRIQGDRDVALASRDYTDFMLKMNNTNPSIFDGIADNIVMTENGDSQRQVNRKVKETFNSILDEKTGLVKDAAVLTWNGRLQTDKNKDILHAKDFNILGDGSDESAKITAMFAIPASQYIFEKDKVYGLSKQLNIPSNSNVVTQGATFKKLYGTSTHAIRINSNTQIDTLKVTCHTVDDKNRGVWISGDNVKINLLDVNYNYDSFTANGKWAVEVKHPNGDALKNITIAFLETYKASCAIFVQNVDYLTINGGLSEYYRTAHYYRDVRDSTISNVVCRYTAQSSNGSPGENAFLIEGTLSTMSTRNVTLNDCVGEDSGEHGYRLGGGKTAQNITYNRCIARRSGSSVNIKNPNAVEWHGGCGFKILGNTSQTGHRHINVTYNQCIVEDLNDTFGTFPDGHGTNNYSAWQIGCAVYVHLNGCTVRTTSVQQISCSMVFEIMASDYVYINGGTFLNYRHYSRIYDADGGYAGWNIPSNHIYFTECVFKSILDSVSMHFFIGTGKYTYTDLHWKDCTFIGQAGTLMRFTPVTDGSKWANNTISGRFEATDKTKLLFTGAADAIKTIDFTTHLDLRYLTHVVLNTSTLYDYDNQQMYVYDTGRWRLQGAVQLPIDPDSVGVLPITEDTGTCEIISASGDTMYIGIFYRSSTSPITHKMYATATNNIVVSPVPLTGTTGESGKVSVYVEQGKLTIENRLTLKRYFRILFK